MNTRLVALAVFAVFSAALTFFLAKTWIDSQRDQMRRQQESMKAQTTESVNVLVAKANLPSGLILAREHLEWKPWPEKGVAKNFLMEGRDKLDDVIGNVVRGGIMASEPIVKGRVVAPGDRGFMAAVLHPGMKAISVKVRPETSVSGFVKPGDFIDLLLLHAAVPATAEAPIEHKIAETILTDIRVIAIDQKPDDLNGNASLSNTVTLEVTRKQAEIVSVATQIGQLSVILRSLARPDAQPDQIANAPERLSRTWDAEASTVLPPVGMPKNRVQVIRGKASENVGISLDQGAPHAAGSFVEGAASAATGSVNAGAAAARVITR
jgi:pilus assembly protein CpaB